jgi:UDP-N-acetylmuramoyl-tripeptide--D-alanyl-D-alanine ligase
MRLRTREIAEATGGRLVGPDVEVTGVAIDSRELRPGALFVPVEGERDGHGFLSDALDAGASAHLARHGAAVPERPDGVAVIEVDDTGTALAAIGALARRHLGEAQVIGVTGSVGKTTTKDLLAGVLATTFATSASLRSFNNELGVPLTLANAPDGTEALVVEMGARGRGHIAELCATARPTVGVVTSVEAVHTELFGDVDEVAMAKAELVESLPATGVAVLNADNPLVAAMSGRTAARVVRVALGPVAGADGHPADVWAEDVVVDAELRPSFRLCTRHGSCTVTLAVRGEHNVVNALLAAATGIALGVGLDAVADGLGRAEMSPWRMELSTTAAGARVLNDAYNAGPASTAAALRALASISATRRVAVLGVMAELGAEHESAHREIARLADEHGIEVIAVAAPDYGQGVVHVDSVDAALAALRREGDLGPDDAILVKASRVAGLEHLAAALLTP